MNRFLQFLMPLIYGLCFSPVILSAQQRNNYVCYEQNIADTSVLVNEDCRFTLSRSLEKLDVDYFSYLDAKKYEINGPSFSTEVYTIDGQEYKFPSPFIEEIVLVKENIGSVALYALPKAFPNKWLLENFSGKVDTSIRNSCEKIWFSNISQLKAHFDVYAFYVKTNDLEKVIESAE